MPQPLVSIVTPCFNAARFLEETIESVLGQDYPALEYVVMDGGSEDGTRKILERYEGRLRWRSEQDRGQADAVNRGFGLTGGEIFAFLNADDTYQPGAVTRAVEGFARNPEAAVVYGDAWHVDEDGRRLSRYPVEPFDAARLARRCIVCQPAAFIRRDAFAECGGLDARLQFALDYDLWIRLAQKHSLVKIDAVLAHSRLHAGAKTVGQTAAAMHETIAVLKRHYGYAPYNWVYGYVHHRRSGQPLAGANGTARPGISAASAGLALAVGVSYNWRHPIRYCRDVVATAREGIAWPSRP
ncbi:MAG TPA: glycosyltransferase family 2 protein [Bryobacteraceae bacterium]|nr:glycosyltransferase family 2 protein [Bryobacteraceae bacterium]